MTGPPLHVPIGTLRDPLPGASSRYIHSILSKTGTKTQLEVVLMARHERLIVEPGAPRARPYKPPPAD
ncbi:MAG TPA: hypothetical protein VM142_02655 [Acidimicrobiales bacterium]|nr:hypothetical protein [Acidimicrobiales bacterium]